MSVTLLLPDRARVVLTWTAHRSGWWLIPLAAVGFRAAMGWSFDAWTGPTALVLTVTWLAAAFVGDRLHDELDRAGVPCRWCDIGAHDDDGEVSA